MIVSTDFQNVYTRTESVHTDKRSNRIYKRLFDVLIASLVTLLVLVWLIPLVGLAIKLTSPGPILFIQLRTGRYGRAFRCFKFRTMTHEASKKFAQVTRNDPAITPIGQFLRKNSLDELPQFLNVLMGEMSVVGPRPHAVDHDKEFWSIIPYYPNRYAVRPGITGLAQVRGARGLTETTQKMARRVRYDLHYIKNRSLLLDVLICWWTIKTVFQGDENVW
ncbi:sugar transferase [Larkinella insperata]|uniref:Sugar transferase n=1 Tax=Larkinella insperata TaxID=332158 RepID=A0ABW3QDI4_9BACT|nr:sugar transferase [Larkinella insperata]